ncbi:MAG: CPBP family intramembrane glutamic endopeptidase [Thermomicrobium sp.]|nr:CPBP family intramembrane metalloprotease [Thermomicrobium sp.]MDW8058682.1 CPBP family intramembrane glutamic endopeptidase [Thermomicrobium sp.]
MWIAELVMLVLGGALLRSAGEAAERSRRMGRVLTLLVVGSGGLALASGLVLLYSGRVDAGVPALLVGIGLLLAWYRPYRAMLARWVPIDPESLLDALGLAAIQAVIASSLGLFLRSAELPSFRIEREQLIAQGMAEIALAFVLVGFPVSRGWEETRHRLGLRWPTKRELWGALAFTGALLAVSLASALLVGWLQPEVAARVEERMVALTLEFGSPAWAIVLGLLAGAGEELLFRGAIQPRYGLFLTALLFTAMHVQYEFSLLTLGVAVMAIVLGVERRWLGTTACILTHASYDAIAVLLGAAMR